MRLGAQPADEIKSQLPWSLRNESSFSRDEEMSEAFASEVFTSEPRTYYQ
jgi:hypothetical protein